MPADEELEAMNNSHQIGIAAARMMEKLEEDYPDGIKIHNAMVLVEVEVPLPLEAGETEDDREHVEVFDFYSTSGYRATQLGIVELCKQQIMHDQQGIIDFGEDESDDA